jgi:UDP-N-acetyl-D-mannosaminuronic acid dehydrogenase
VSTIYGTSGRPALTRRAIADGELPIAVYGLGKMGLPMAAVYAERSGNVTGVDVDPSVAVAVDTGESHIQGEPGLAELVAEQVDRGALSATTDGVAAAEAATVHVVIVPTPLNDAKQPDLEAVTAALNTIAEGLEEGELVCIECTVPPGTCRDAADHLAAVSGLSPDQFGVAFCPERTSSGQAIEDIRGAYPKVVGGIDPESTRVAELLYGELSDNEIIAVTDATTAEAVKLFEGLYRDVNIALANELAWVQADLGIDVREAIEVANTQPFCEIHDPGAGVGGHCIPWYPHFLMSQTEEPTPLLETARAVNNSMPWFTVEWTTRELEAMGTPIEDATVAVLGLTYRPGVAETRATPAAPIIEQLQKRGASVVACDPMIEGPTEFNVDLMPVEELASLSPDAIVLVTPHEEFAAVDWDAYSDAVLIDGRDAVPSDAAVGRRYTIGRGRSQSDAEVDPTAPQ